MSRVELIPRLLVDSRDYKAWTIHEGSEHLGWLEQWPNGWWARRVDGKSLAKAVKTKELATSWLLAKRLGIEAAAKRRPVTVNIRREYAQA